VFTDSAAKSYRFYDNSLRGSRVLKTHLPQGGTVYTISAAPLENAWTIRANKCPNEKSFRLSQLTNS